MNELIEDMGLAIADTGPDGCEGGADAFRACRRDLCSCRSAARAALAAINARGDRVVPGVATGEMEMSGMGAFPDDLAGIYKWMLSASPYAPEETK
jgi:hypothetical protein